jgi:hypothetical protein
MYEVTKCRGEWKFLRAGIALLTLMALTLGGPSEVAGQASFQGPVLRGVSFIHPEVLVFGAVDENTVGLVDLERAMDSELAKLPVERVQLSLDSNPEHLFQGGILQFIVNTVSTEVGVSYHVYLAFRQVSRVISNEVPAIAVTWGPEASTGWVIDARLIGSELERTLRRQLDSFTQAFLSQNPR